MYPSPAPRVPSPAPRVAPDPTLTMPTVCDVPPGILERYAAMGSDADHTVRDDARSMNVWAFPSIDRMLGYAAKYNRSLGRCHGDPAWYGTNDLETALYMGGEIGWPEAARIALDVYDSISHERLESLLPVLTLTDEGDEVDIEAYLAGDDECMLATRVSATRVGGRTHATIAYSLFASYSTNTIDIVRRGVAVAAMAHLLETAGVRVEIVVFVCFTCGSTGNGRGFVSCPIKHFGQALDLPRVTYWLAHPSAYRRIVFAVDRPAPHYLEPTPAWALPEGTLVVDSKVAGDGEPIDAVRRMLEKHGMQFRAR